MPQRRHLAALLAAVALPACAGSSPGPTASTQPGIVVITAGGTALGDGVADVPPTLDLRISAGRQLGADEVSATLDGARLSLRDAGGTLAATTAPMTLGSAHGLDLVIPGRGHTAIAFHVIGPVPALAAVHTDTRDGTVLDLAFGVAPDHAAVESAVPGGARTWVDDSHLRVVWRVAPGGRAAVPAATPTARGSHLAASLVAELGPVAAGGLRLATAPTPPQPAGKPLVLAFSVGTDASRASLAAHAAQISVVSPTGLRAAADGTLLGTVDPPSLAAASARGLPVWPLVQNDGFDAAAVSRLLHDDNAVGRLVASLAALATRTGLGGIDLDFEELDPADRAALTAFVDRLGRALHAGGGRLAVAVVPHKPGGLNLHSDVYDLPAIAAAADLVTVMAYEQHGQRTQPGPVGGLDWMRAIVAGTAPQLIGDRTLLGLATYARSWSSGGAVADGYAPAVAAALATPGARVDEDFPADSLVIHGGDGGITYADPGASIAGRVGLAAEHHLAGVAMWRLGFEDPAVWSELPSTAPRP